MLARSPRAGLSPHRGNRHRSDEVANNFLSGTDIDESSLNLDTGAGAMLGRAALGTGLLFASPIGSSTAAADENAVSFLTPHSSLVVRDLSIRLTAAPGVCCIRTFALRVNGVDSVVGCVFSELDVNCDSGLESVTIPASSTVSLTTTGGGVTADALFGWRAVSP